jgi:uncharacterized protein YndB with AHSA1/START domain
MSSPTIHVTDSNTATAEDTVVSFPKGKRRSESPIFTHNELFIAAPAERIFAALVRATQWPEFYGNAKNIVIEGDASELTLGTLFHWTTFGVRVHTTIEELVPNRRLAWSGRALGSTAYHGWVIEPKQGGCLVVTEETQQGFVPSVGRWFLRGGLLKWHQRWLEGLAEVASSTLFEGEHELNG